MKDDLKNSTPIANPEIVFRVEFDDCAILFDPDTGKTYGLDPVSVFIWKKLDGTNTVDDISLALEKECKGNVPEEAPQDIEDFIKELEKNSLIGYQK